MKKLKNKSWIYTIGRMVASLAVMVTALSVNSACWWIMHQDELPKTANNLRRF